VSACAAPNCAIPVNAEIGPPFCGPHWDMLGPAVKGNVHTEPGMALALLVIEQGEAWRAKNPSTYCRRPSAQA
jgi:hypothetical protein